MGGCAHSALPKLPEDDRLLLGITIQGIASYAQRINFPEGYTRDTKDAWMAELERYDTGYTNSKMHKVGEDMTGYDFAEAIRRWLTAEDKKENSVCEVLKEEGSEHVGRAQVFYSHVQLPHVTYREITITDTEDIKTLPKTFGLLWRMRNAAMDRELDWENTRFWVDFVVLRQCVHDFDLVTIRCVIAQIGKTMVELDAQHTYLQRSFCIFEVEATISGGAKILVATTLPGENKKMGVKNHHAELMKEKPVNSEGAKCRSKEHKAIIDEYIKANMGFDSLNKNVVAAIMKGAKAHDKGRHPWYLTNGW